MQDDQTNAVSYAIEQAAASLTADNPKAVLDRAEYDLQQHRCDQRCWDIVAEVLGAARYVADERAFLVSEANPQPGLVRV